MYPPSISRGNPGASTAASSNIHTQADAASACQIPSQSRGSCKTQLKDYLPKPPRGLHHRSERRGGNSSKAQIYMYMIGFAPIVPVFCCYAHPCVRYLRSSTAERSRWLLQTVPATPPLHSDSLSLHKLRGSRVKSLSFGVKGS